LKHWQFLAVVYNAVFSGPEKSRFACGRIYFYTQHTVATTEGHEVTPFLSLDFFYKMPGQNTKGSKNLLMAKKPELGPIQRRKTQELLWPTAWAARSLQ
jgi:hypothetical protein